MGSCGLFRQKLRVFLNTYNRERKSQQTLFFVCVGQFQEEKKEARSLPSSFFLLLSSSSSFVSVARSMHVFTPGASVVRFTEEETRSTFEPLPSRARKKNAVATASLFPPRERKKNTRRRPKEFKKSSKMGSSSFERARKMTSKKAYRIIDVLVRVRHGRSLRLWRLL